MKTTILSASLLLLLSSCTPTKTTNNLNAIDIAGSFEHLTELKVSQLGKNIRYVPLETTDSSLIGNSYNIKLLKDKILVATEGSCLAFDKQTGKYLGTIGHKGGDPEGYSEVVYYIHPQTGILYFHRQPNKLVKYNQDGEFLGETIQPKSLLQGFCAAFADSLIIGHYGGGIGTSPFESKLIYSNEEGKATDSISNFSRNIPTITPNDIASISVFKGGSGKEAFGMLGYNGLIYLTYKDTKNSQKNGKIWINKVSVWY